MLLCQFAVMHYIHVELFNLLCLSCYVMCTERMRQRARMILDVPHFDIMT